MTMLLVLCSVIPLFWLIPFSVALSKENWRLGWRLGVRDCTIASRTASHLPSYIIKIPVNIPEFLAQWNNLPDLLGIYCIKILWKVRSEGALTSP
jgi:hypothetical protein